MSWYYRNINDYEYYTPHPRSKTRYRIIGDGTHTPTGEDFIVHMDENPEADICSGTNGLCSIDYDVNDTMEKPINLPPGQYHYAVGGRELPERLIPTSLRDDNLVDMHGTYDDIIKDVSLFLKNEKLYRDIGIQYRRGILLYGPPGQGKTTTIRRIIKEHVPSDSVVIFLSDLPTTTMLKAFRDDDMSKRLKIIVFEELAAVIKNNSSQIDRILDFLDGELSLDHALLIATTNYPEAIPGNIVDRPSRFDSLIRMADPDPETCKALLEMYLSRDPTEEEIKDSKGLSVAAIKETSLFSRLYQVTYARAVKRMAKTRELVKKEFSENEQVGFVSKNRSLRDLLDEW